MLIIAGIWIWTAPDPQVEIYPVPGYDIVDGQRLTILSLTMMIPDNMIWTRGAPWKHQTGEYMTGDASIAGYVTFRAEQPYPGTNYFDGFVQIATAQTSESQCMTAQRDGETNSVNMEADEFVSGIPAFTANFNGAAAGTFMESSVTHVYHGGICYEMSMNIFSGNIGNYPEGTVTEFPEDEVRSVMQAIIDSAAITTQ